MIQVQEQVKNNEMVRIPGHIKRILIEINN